MSPAIGLALVATALAACVPCTPSRCCGRPAVGIETPATALSIEQRYRALAEQNLCPEGVAFLQDTWRFVGESRTPDFVDEWAIQGTRFTERLSGRPDGGERLEATLEGEIRCLEDNRVLVRVDSVTPDGAFGNHAGDAYPCDVLTEVSGRSRRVLMVCFFGWDLRPAAGLEFEYERVPTRAPSSP